MNDFSELEPSRQRPNMPADKEASIAILEKLESLYKDVADLAEASDVEWAHKLAARKVSNDVVRDFFNRLDQVKAKFSTFEQQLNSAGIRDAGSSLSGFKDLLTKLLALTEDHQSASLATIIGEMPRDRIDTLISDIAHLANLDESIKRSLLEEGETEEKFNTVLAAEGAASNLRDEFNVKNLDEAIQLYQEMESDTEVLEGNIRQLTVLASRLEMHDCTLQDIEGISNACAIASKHPSDTLVMLAEVSPALQNTISDARKKVTRIQHAAGLLDDRIGTQWRQEPFSKLEQAAKNASIPGHPSHPKIGAYARSIGIASNIQSTLDAAYKTRKGLNDFAIDPILTRALPKSFKGFETDFDALDKLLSIRNTIEAPIKDLAQKDLIMSIITSPLSDFLGFADLGGKVHSIPFPVETPLRRVRMLYNDRKVRLYEHIKSIEIMPVEDHNKTMIEALRIGHLIRGYKTTLERIEASEEIKEIGAKDHFQLLNARKWHDDLCKILPKESLPHGDEGYSKLHVHVRTANTAFLELSSALTAFDKTLPGLAIPDHDLPLPEFSKALDDLINVEPVMHAQVLVYEVMSEIMASDMNSFISRMNQYNIPFSDWKERLKSDYDLIDRLDEEDEFSKTLMLSVNDALADVRPPSGEDILNGRLPVYLDEKITWVEEIIEPAA